MTGFFAVAFIAAVIISASLIVILIGHLGQHRKAANMQSEFNRLSDEFGLSIAEQDVLGDRIIGLDKANGNLLFVEKKGEGHIVDLDDVKNATISKEYGLVFDGYNRRTGAKTAIKRIGVELFYKNTAASILLPLYDNENGDELKRSEAVELALKWEKLISGILPNHLAKNGGKASGRMYVGAV
ncbi:MAG TPA: hypothetical protein VMR70_11695 [Flavisolibacter sp.]|nr:hypothetical protein [Flavisolibacter sp.]